MAQRETADRHVPVMRDRCIRLLSLGVENIRAAGHRPVVIVATLGMAPAGPPLPHVPPMATGR